MKENLLLAAALTSICVAAPSCSGSGSTTENNVDTLHLKGETVIPYDDLRQPRKLFATDDRIYILNWPTVDTLIDEFSTSGQFIKRSLPKGQGRGEASRVEASYYDAARNAINFSMDNSKLMSLSGIKSPEPKLETVYEFDAEKTGNETYTPGYEKWLMANGNIISGSMSRDGFFSIIDNDGKFVKYAVDYIPASEFGEGAPEYLIYNFLRPIGGPTPDGRHGAWAMGLADMLVFANAESDSVSFITKYVAPPKGIEFTVGENSSSFSYTPEFTSYYEGEPALSNSHAYLQYSGMKQSDLSDLKLRISKGECQIPEREVRVFDFDGNLKRIIYIDGGYIGQLGVSPDDSKLYFVSENEDGEILVQQYDLPPIE